MKKKIFRQQKVIKQDLFIPAPSAKTFVGVHYYMHGRFALYDQECLRRNLLRSLDSVDVDATKPAWRFDDNNEAEIRSLDSEA